MFGLHTVVLIVGWIFLFNDVDSFTVLPQQTSNMKNRNLMNAGIRRNSITSLYSTNVETSFMWNRGLNFGKGQFKFYDGFDKWMSVFPKEDQTANPELFNLPDGVYEVRLTKPLGIVFEEIEFGKGVFVKELVDNGNAAKDGSIQLGDVLVGITAVKVVGAKYERRLIPSRKFDFDTVVGAIGSNDSRYGCEDVICVFEIPSIANSAQVDSFMTFFEPPFDNPWKQQQ